MNRHQRRVRNASLKSVPAIAAAIDKIENVEAVGNQLGIVQRQLYQISVLLNMVEEESKLRHKAMIRMFSTIMNVSEADAEVQFERYYQEAQEDANPKTDTPVATEESPSPNSES